jgi:hypothetical protein
MAGSWVRVMCSPRSKKCEQAHGVSEVLQIIRLFSLLNRDLFLRNDILQISMLQSLFQVNLGLAGMNKL